MYKKTHAVFYLQTCVIYSDHYLIIINWTTDIQSPLNISYRKNIKNINWELYSAFIEDYINNNPNTDNLTENYIYIIQIINKYLDTLHPYNKKIIQYKKIRPIWWNVECSKVIAIKRLALRQYKKHMTLDNYIKIKKISAQAKRTIKEVKQKSWINYCNNINKTSNISDIWKNIKWYTQKKTHNTRGETDNKWIEDLLHNLAPDDVIPDLTSIVNNINNNNSLNQPISYEEFNATIPVKINKSSPGSDNITCNDTAPTICSKKDNGNKF